MKEALSLILKEKKLAYVIVGHNLLISELSPGFSQVTTIRLSQTKKKYHLYQIFPELIGSEEQVEAILQNRLKRYDLEKINKILRKGDLKYYDLILLPLKNKSNDKNQLLCMLTETTDETSLEQQLRQKKYEIELLQAHLSNVSSDASGYIIGESEPIQKVKVFVKKMADVKSSSILLQGESGTGKNLVAKAIHKASMIHDAPFVELNCASIPSTLIESELFGYEKGAFTDARSGKQGLLEAADGGTLFLDEIGELPIELQSKFLSFLETKKFRRLGSTKELAVNIRIIAATNKDLNQAIEDNKFRQDLFYRINVINLTLPPLRELGNDIILIAENFIQIFSFNFKKKITGLSKGAQAKLMNYYWFGNVRELRNVIERAVIFSDENMISEENITLFNERKPCPDYSTHFGNLPEKGWSLNVIEKNLIIEALKKLNGNQSKAARFLDITLDTLRYRMKKHQIS